MKNPTGTKNIHLFAFQNDQLQLPYKCEECECGEAAVPNAPECNTQGTLVCGGCKCNAGYKGIAYFELMKVTELPSDSFNKVNLTEDLIAF